jgi:hypothetical protein
MDKNILLLFMIICYVIQIYYVYNNYTFNSSLSNVICHVKRKYVILFFML